MRSMIFDTQGTGFYKGAVAQMMAQKELTFLDGLGGAGGRSGGLGDEIMLLAGLDDLGAAYPHGFDDGPARTYTMPTSDRSTNYDFQTGPMDIGLNGARLGPAINELADGWPRQGAKPNFRYSGLAGPGWPSQGAEPSFRYSGLGRVRRPIRPNRYRYSGLDALGGAREDATAIAASTRDACTAGCSALTDAGARAACNAACGIAYTIAASAINAAYPAGTPTGAPPTGGCDAACIEAKLNAIAAASADHGGAPVTPPVATDDGISTNTLIIGGIVVAGLLGAFLILK